MGFKLLIHDYDTERFILSVILRERGLLQEIREKLNEDCFFSDFHKEVYRIIIEIADKGERPDELTVATRLLSSANIKFDPSVWFELTQAYETSDVTEAYRHACRLHDLSIRRKLGKLGQYLLDSATSESEDILDITNEASEELASLFKSESSEISTLDDSIKLIHEIIYNNQLDEKPMTGTPTGFKQLDEKSGGLQKSDLVVIAGDTSQGKTSFATSIMRNAASSGAKIAMYSMEMKQEQIAARLLAMETGIPSSQIMYSRLPPYQLDILDKGIGQLHGKGIYFDDRSTSSIDMILSSIRYMKIKHNIDGAIVDYLQILNVNMKGASDEQQMGTVARRLKNIAKELDIWIIALSQLSRDKDNTMPTSTRIRGSGQIAEAADNVILVYRPEAYGKMYTGEFSNVSADGTALINIAKGRNIGLMKFICGFDKDRTLFFDLSNMPIPQEEDQPF